MMHSYEAPGASVAGIGGQPERLKSESVRVIELNGTELLFVTTNLNLTVLPSVVNGPVGLSASFQVAPLSTLTYFSTSMLAVTLVKSTVASSSAEASLFSLSSAWTVK